MLTINNLLNQKNINFKSIAQSKNLLNPFSIKNTKLAPLAKDTVSFTSKQSLETIENEEQCRELHEDAKVVHDKMTGLIGDYFNDYIYDKDSNPSGLINPIDARIKTPDSIREKVISKIQKAFKEKKAGLPKVFSPYDKKQIKDNVRDITGTQITLRNAEESTDTVINTLCKMIDENDLIVDEIENHVPNGEGSMSYFSKEQLEKLRKTVNIVRKRHGADPEEIKVKTNEKTSGYTALHISFDLKNDARLKKNCGYYHEMQIIGSDVEILKDVENFCYKLKNDFDIKQGNFAYSPFVEYFLKYYPADKKDQSKKSKELRNNFDEYTKIAYEIQRNRVSNNNDAKDDVTNWAYRYPTIEECGFKGKIPVELDFNNLARIKRDCDDIYKLSTHAQEILDGKEQDLDLKGKIKFNKSKSEE